jgi:hypothetical protein
MGARSEEEGEAAVRLCTVLGAPGGEIPPGNATNSPVVPQRGGRQLVTRKLPLWVPAGAAASCRKETSSGAQDRGRVTEGQDAQCFCENSVLRISRRRFRAGQLGSKNHAPVWVNGTAYDQEIIIVEVVPPPYQHGREPTGATRLVAASASRAVGRSSCTILWTRTLRTLSAVPRALRERVGYLWGYILRMNLQDAEFSSAWTQICLPLLRQISPDRPSRRSPVELPPASSSMPRSSARSCRMRAQILIGVERFARDCYAASRRPSMQVIGLPSGLD